MPFLGHAMLIAAHLVHPQSQAQQALDPPHVVRLVTAMFPQALKPTAFPVETLINGKPFIMYSTASAVTSSPGQAAPSSTAPLPGPIASRGSPGQPSATPTLTRIADAGTGDAMDAIRDAVSPNVAREPKVVFPPFIEPKVVSEPPKPSDPPDPPAAANDPPAPTPVSVSDPPDPPSPVTANDPPSLSSVQSAQNAPIPEPATWLMMLLGFGCFLFVRPKKNRRLY